MRRGIITLSIANIASKPVGLLRQMVFAIFYGVTAVMAACRFAQTITLAFMNFFTTDTLNAGFLPLYERYKKDSPALAISFFWYLFVLLFVLSGLIFGLLYFGAPWMVEWFAPGFHGTIVIESIEFIRVFSFTVPFCLLGTLLSYLAMSGGSYLGVSTRAFFESLGLIAGVLWSVVYHQVLMIAWAFVIAYAFFFCMMVAVCYQHRLLSRVKISDWLAHRAILRKDFWRTIRPLLILPLFMQGKFIVEKSVASLLAVSVVASLDYARFIIDTGINIMAAPVALLGLSAFSIIDGKQLTEKLELVVNILLNFGVPITLFLIVNARLVVAILYGYGAFDDYAINQSSVILCGMAFAFFAQIIGYVLIKVLNAKLQNHRAMGYLVAAIICDLLFIVAFYRTLGPVVLGIGESIYAFVVFILCVNYFKLIDQVRSQLKFLLPAACIYGALAFYMVYAWPMHKWEAFFAQSLFFVIYWSILFWSNQRTRALFLEI